MKLALSQRLHYPIPACDEESEFPEIEDLFEDEVCNQIDTKSIRFSRQSSQNLGSRVGVEPLSTEQNRNVLPSLQAHSRLSLKEVRPKEL